MLWIIMLGQLYAQDIIKYEFKKYEKFDLGDLSVKGDLIAPGDLSVRERDNRFHELEIFERKNFNDLSEKNNYIIR